LQQRLRTLVILVFLAALVAVAFASGTRAAIVEQDGATVRLSGKIRATTSLLFTNALARALLQSDPREPIVVKLNSAGGDTHAAHDIADMIHAARRHGASVTTRVEAGSYCLSACPLIFSAGDDRLAGATAMFLFHGVTYRGPRSTQEVAATLAAEKQRYLNRMRAADRRLGRFLTDNRIVEDGIDTAFAGADLRSGFPEFVTALIAPSAAAQSSMK